MKKTIASLLLAVAALSLAGCTAPETHATPKPTVPVSTGLVSAEMPPTVPQDAWDACLAMNDDLYPDGLVSAHSEARYDSSGICRSTVEAQGPDKFTDLFRDPLFIERQYEARGL